MSKMNKIKTVLGQVLSKAKVDENADEKRPKGGKTVSIERKFYEEMVSYFRAIVESRSVGKSMIFHMGYLVWLDKDDYAVLRDELIMLVPEVVDAYYDIIKEYRDVYFDIAKNDKNNSIVKELNGLYNEKPLIPFIFNYKRNISKKLLIVKYLIIFFSLLFSLN